MRAETAVIIGAGPAGLTAAYELLTRTDIKPVVLEMSGALGGIARTVNYKGNRIDVGGHRFFSKSDRVTAWWLNLLPLENVSTENAPAAREDHPSLFRPSGDRPDPATTDRVMLLRPRKSRIYYRRRFYDYPIRLNRATVVNLGLFHSFRIAVSCVKASGAADPR